MERKFFYFPKQQNLCLLYSTTQVLKSRLFKALSIQISPKKSFALKLRRSKIGHFFFILFFNETAMNLQVPNNQIKIGYVSNGKKVMFQLNDNNEPIYVYKEHKQNEWKKENFIGYTLIEKYKKEEYFNKIEFVKDALEIRWKEILINKKLHGDFTHLNILVNTANGVTFIDEKHIENSILFDHYYFYSYFIQCIERSKGLYVNEIKEVKRSLQQLIKNTCKLDRTALIDALEAISTKDANGLTANRKENSIQAFKEFMLG